VERAVKDRVSRLFSTDEAPPPSSPDPHLQTGLTAPSPDKDSGNGSILESPTKAVSREPGGAEGGTPAASSPLDSSHIPSDEVVGRFCALLKPQLEKAHEEVVRRYGESGGVKLIDMVAAAGGQDDIWLKEVVESQLAIIERVLSQTPPMTPAAGPTDAVASSQDPTPVRDMAASAAATTPTIRQESAPDTSLVDDGLEDFAKVVSLSPGSFLTMDAVPAAHKFKLTVFQPSNMKSFVQSVRKEIRLLQSSLPPGITVRGFEERMDLYSAMIEGPKNTPYEDGLFFFDFQLGKARYR